MKVDWPTVGGVDTGPVVATVADVVAPNTNT